MKSKFSNNNFFHIDKSNDSPIVLTAIHNAHKLREETLHNINIHENIRLLEEDPFTDYFTKIGKNYILPEYSRFEVDLNRSRDKAIYLKPEDAWGLNVRKEIPSNHQIKKSLEIYDEFYNNAYRYFSKLLTIYPKIFVWDIHSYNYLREGKNKPAPQSENPDIILGTNILSSKYNKFVSRLINILEEPTKEFPILDVRQNIKFSGGEFSRWINRTFEDKVIAIAIEFKKIWMNERTGEVFHKKQIALRNNLEKTLDFIKKYLREENND